MPPKKTTKNLPKPSVNLTGHPGLIVSAGQIDAWRSVAESNGAAAATDDDRARLVFALRALDEFGMVILLKEGAQL